MAPWGRGAQEREEHGRDEGTTELGGVHIRASWVLPDGQAASNKSAQSPLPSQRAGAPGTCSAPGKCPLWPLSLLLPEANSLHRGPLPPSD